MLKVYSKLPGFHNQGTQRSFSWYLQISRFNVEDPSKIHETEVYHELSCYWVFYEGQIKTKAEIRSADHKYIVCMMLATGKNYSWVLTWDSATKGDTDCWETPQLATDILWGSVIAIPEITAWKKCWVHSRWSTGSTCTWWIPCDYPQGVFFMYKIIIPQRFASSVVTLGNLFWTIKTVDQFGR